MTHRFMKTAAASAVFAVAALTATASNAIVLTFEDLPAGSNFFTSDYQGFRIGNNNPQTTAWFWTDQVSTFYTPRSGDTYLATDFQLYLPNTNPSEATQAITRATDFGFEGAWFSGGDQIRYDLYNDGVLVFSSTPSATLTATPIFVASGYAAAVDSVVIFGRQGFYAMDDFTYNLTPIPEPTTLGMMVAGLVGVGALARRRRTVR